MSRATTPDTRTHKGPVLLQKDDLVYDASRPLSTVGGQKTVCVLMLFSLISRTHLVCFISLMHFTTQTKWGWCVRRGITTMCLCVRHNTKLWVRVPHILPWL
jgi:hypothetical protein